MALRLRRDVQKASYYVWFLGAEEAKGLRGARVINSVLPYLIDRSRSQEPLKVTLQVSHKGIKIVQGSSKHLIPHSAITSSVQTDDIVACVLLLYNPATKCPLHVHAYRCDSESTAEALHLQLQILINRPDNQKRFEELETRLGILPPLPTSSGHNSKSTTGEQHMHGPKSLTSMQHQSQHAYPQQQPPATHRRHESSPKRFSSSLGSDTGNSTRESECSEEQGGAGGAGSPISRSPPNNTKAQQHPHPHLHQLPHQQQLSAQQNSDLFDSLAAELRAKLNGNGPPLLLPPRDYDTVHRSKGNLTAIELRRCRNTLIVGGAVPQGAAAAASTNAANAAATAINGKQVSSRGSSGIGSDLAPSPERQDLNSSSDDEHWSNEADNSVIALKPSQIAMERSGPIIPHHVRKSTVKQPEDNYLRDLPAKPYMPREHEREREQDRNVKTPSSWTREDEIKPIIMRPTDYDVKFNRVLQAEQKLDRHHPPPAANRPHKLDAEKHNEINRLLKQKLSQDKERASPDQYQREQMPRYSKNKTDYVRQEEYDFDSDPACDQMAHTSQNYRKENLTDKQKFMEYTTKKQQQQQLKSYAAGETQRYGANSRHRYVDPVELPFEQPTPGHNKYAAIHRGVRHSPERIDLGQNTTERREHREREQERHERVITTDVPPVPRHNSREVQREKERERDRDRERERDNYSRSKERNPYREAESLPYIQSMEKMMKSSAMRYKTFEGPVESSGHNHHQQQPYERDGDKRKGSGARKQPEFVREYAASNSSYVSPRDRFKDAKDKFRAMERSSSRFDLLDERNGVASDYKPRRRGSMDAPNTGRVVYEDWSDDDDDDDGGDNTTMENAERSIKTPSSALPPGDRSRSRTREEAIWNETHSLGHKGKLRHGHGSEPTAASRHDGREYSRHDGQPPSLPVAATASSKRDLRELRELRDRRENSRDQYRTIEPAAHQPLPQGFERSASRGQRDRDTRVRERSREFIAQRDYSTTPPMPPMPSMEATRTMEKSLTSTSSTQRHHGHHADMYPSASTSATPTPSSNAGGGDIGISPSPGSHKHLSSMPKGYRHSYAEPVFARSGGRVGLAAVNPY